MVLRKLDIHLQKNETEPPAYMTYIIVLKWIKDLNEKDDDMDIEKDVKKLAKGFESCDLTRR